MATSRGGRANTRMNRARDARAKSLCARRLGKRLRHGAGTTKCLLGVGRPPSRGAPAGRGWGSPTDGVTQARARYPHKSPTHSGWPGTQHEGPSPIGPWSDADDLIPMGVWFSRPPAAPDAGAQGHVQMAPARLHVIWPMAQSLVFFLKPQVQMSKD